MAKINILGIPMDLGAGRRGVDMGPSALRLAKLASTLTNLGHSLEDLGNINSPIAEAIARNGDAHYVDVIADACKEAYGVLKNLPADVFPIILGGDHSISMGTVAGVARGNPGDMGVIWVDAHTDVNTPETSPSGNVHGMPMSHLLGHGNPALRAIWGDSAVLNPEDVVFIGLRSVDEAERAFIHDYNIKAYTMKEIDKRGMAHVAQETIEYLSDKRQLHVSFDADALDPAIAPGVGTPVQGGLTFREAHLLMEMLADSGRVTSLDIVEVNPILDVQNKTARIMVEMVASLFGKSIL